MQFRISSGLFLVLILGAAAVAQAQSAPVLISPSASDPPLPADVTFSWSPVTSATAYYLYVGTTVGAKDIVNTGELATTSYSGSNLPPGITLYIRTWAKVGGHWSVYSDTQSQTSLAARVIRPVAGTQDLPTSLQFIWQRISGAQAYYLYVGTSLGAKDIVNTGELAGTSFNAPSLPDGTTLYVRMWTKVGIWRYVDSTVATTMLTARLLSPQASDSNVHPRVGFSWTSVPGAAAYYLYVGSAVGLKDVIDSGELHRTTFTSLALQGARHYYVRLYTRKNNIWLYRDYEFDVRKYAALTNPLPGSASNDPSLSLQWNPVLGAVAYYVHVGSTAGASDLFNSGELARQSIIARGMPGGAQVYVRLWTRINGAWLYEDSLLTTRAIPRIASPAPGAIGVSSASILKWNAVAGAQEARVDFGSTLGGNDLASVPATGTSMQLPALPVMQAIYVRLWMLSQDQWVYDDTVFATLGSLNSAWMLYPTPGGYADQSNLFEWAAPGLEKSYRLRIGTAPGLSDVYESGQISVTRHRVPGLPVGITLYGSIDTTYLSGATGGRQFTFTSGGSDISFAQRLDVARRLAGDVRNMATDNRPNIGTLLEDVVRSEGRDSANCDAYADTMVAMIAQMNLGVIARDAHACLVPNQLDCHTLVEILDQTSGTWILTDPTFGLAPRRTSDRVAATLDDMSNAARNLAWTTISYDFFTSAGDAYARAYYLDYPILFAQPYTPYTLVLASPVNVNTVGSYYQQVASPARQYGAYAILCSSAATQTVATIDGNLITLVCDPDLAVTPVFLATTAITSDAGATLLKPLRFIFSGAW